MYKLSPLTNTELIDLYEALEHLGFWMLKLKALHVAEEFELEDLLEAAGDELFKRATEDSESIPERKHDD